VGVGPAAGAAARPERHVGSCLALMRDSPLPGTRTRSPTEMAWSISHRGRKGAKPAFPRAR
jgi:hypothetical protein